jgi:hypothetical protein
LYLQTYVLVVFSAARGWTIRRERALEYGLRPVWPVNLVQESINSASRSGPGTSEPNDDKPDACIGPLPAANTIALPSRCRLRFDVREIRALHNTREVTAAGYKSACILCNSAEVEEDFTVDNRYAFPKCRRCQVTGRLALTLIKRSMQTTPRPGCSR